MVSENDQGLMPDSEPVLLLIARARDTNMFGDIYAGWLVDHMDQAAETVATGAAQGRCATVSIDQLDFMSPIPVGSRVAIYASAPEIGRSSITVTLEAWIQGQGDPIKVTQGTWVMVSIGQDGRIRPL